MPQEVTVRIGKKDSPSSAISKVKSGIREAQTRADHAKNVSASRDAADREKTFFGGGDMSGDKDSVAGDIANAYTREAAKLPVHDAEDMARRNASAAGANQKVKGSMASGGTIPETGLYKMHAGEKVIPVSSSSSRGGGTMSHERHTGEAENVRAPLARQNSPFRELHQGGHNLNHGYKVPAAKISLDLSENHSYMNPMDHGSGGMKPEVPKGVWTKASSVKPMSQTGPGKSGPPKIS